MAFVALLLLGTSETADDVVVLGPQGKALNSQIKEQLKALRSKIPRKDWDGQVQDFPEDPDTLRKEFPNIWDYMCRDGQIPVPSKVPSERIHGLRLALPARNTHASLLTSNPPRVLAASEFQTSQMAHPMAVMAAQMMQQPLLQGNQDPVRRSYPRPRIPALPEHLVPPTSASVAPTLHLTATPRLALMDGSAAGDEKPTTDCDHAEPKKTA